LTLDPINLDYEPHLPPKTDYGIAIVGCGTIVTSATLPCYRKHELNIIGCYDINPEASATLARRFGIPKVYRTLSDLLADPKVEIVEVAVLPRAQLEIVRQVAAARKHLLCQKPLSDIFAEAVDIVRLARQAGIKLAVNQQMRWDQAIRAANTLIKQGWIGKPTDATIQASFFSNIPGTVWAEIPRYEILFHSIHYIDSIRFLFGDPNWITSRHARYPLEGRVLGETKTITVFDYDTGLQVAITVNMCNPSDERFFIFRFIGTEGVISGTLGISKYPEGEPDTLTWSSNSRCSGLRFEAKLEGTYLPDSFIGPIASLMQAIQENGVPETAGDDNLNTLRIAEAAYKSAAENRSVRLAEIESER
jgi:predicted dehydrogenase